MRIWLNIIMAFMFILPISGCEGDKSHEELRKAVATKKQGKIKEAITMYTKLIDDGAFKANANERSILFYNRGIAFSELGNGPQSACDYSKAIELRPKFVTCYHNRSIIYERMGKLKHSIEDVEWILQMEPRDTDAQKRLEYLKTKIVNSEKRISQMRTN